MDKSACLKRLNKELELRKEKSDKLAEYMKLLEEDRDNLKLELKRNENRLEDCVKCCDELELLKDQENIFCDGLLKHQQSIENSNNFDEIMLAKKELDNFLEQRLNSVMKNPELFLTIEGLRHICKTESVYAVEQENNSNAYGKLSVRDGKVWISSFKSEKPTEKSRLIQLKVLLARFSKTTELPQMAFLQLSPEGEDQFNVVISTEGHTPRVKNFLLLCSGLKGINYKGMQLSHPQNWKPYYSLEGNIPAVVEGVTTTDGGWNSRQKGVVWTLHEKCSSFGIWMEYGHRKLCEAIGPKGKIGEVAIGFEKLEQCLGQNKKLLIAETGLVIGCANQP